MKLKDKKIQILVNRGASGETDDSGFYLPDEWVPIHEGELWAYYRHLSGKEMNASNMVDIPLEDALFVVNWRDNLTTDMIIKYKSKYYDIKRIDDYQGYKADLNVYCVYNAARYSEIEGGAGN